MLYSFLFFSLSFLFLVFVLSACCGDCSVHTCDFFPITFFLHSATVSRVVNQDTNIILDMMKPIVGDTLVSTSEKSDVWKRQHKELLPTFRHDVVSSKVPIIVGKVIEE